MKTAGFCADMVGSARSPSSAANSAGAWMAVVSSASERRRCDEDDCCSWSEMARRRSIDGSHRATMRNVPVGRAASAVQ